MFRHLLNMTSVSDKTEILRANKHPNCHKQIIGIALLCDELKPDIFVTSKHGLKVEHLGIFKIYNYEMAESLSRIEHKLGSVAMFVKGKIKCK